MSTTTRVLIIEDDLHTRDMVRRVLERDLTLRYLNIEVVEAADGEEGLAKFAEATPQLVITDLLMPKVDGFQVIEAIRKTKEGASIPLLVTSAVYRDKKTIGTLQRKFGVEVHSKPFMPQALAKRVHQMLRPKPAEAGAGSELADQPPRVPTTAVAERCAETRPVSASTAEGTADLDHSEVRRPGSRIASNAVVARGNLAEKQVPRLLIELLDRQFTGSLDLRRGKVRKVVHFMAGHPIFVQSNLRSETLGQMLIRRGGLTAEQHARALALAKDQSLKYGEALVRLELMSERGVMAELLAQTREKLESCLGWQEGEYLLVDDPAAPVRVPHCVLDPVPMVFKGLHRFVNVEDAFARVASKSRHKLKLSPRFSVYRDAYVQVFGVQLLDAVGRGVPLREAIQLAGPGGDAVIQVDILLQTGLAELVAPLEDGVTQAPEPIAELPLSRPEPALPLEQLTRGLGAQPPEPALEAADRNAEAWNEENSSVICISPEMRAVLQQSRETEQVDVALQLIHSTYLGLHDATHYAVLGLTPESERDRIEVAYQIKRKQFALSKFAKLDLGEHYQHLEEICTALDEAFTVLADPTRRAAYDATLEQGSADDGREQALSAEELCRRGDQLMVERRYEDAAEAFAQAANQDEQAEYFARRAIAHFFAHSSGSRGTEQAAQGAMMYVQEALAIDPGSLGARMAAATISRAMGHLDEALQHLMEILEADPAQQQAFDDAEEVLLELGTHDALELLYRKTLHRLGDRNPEWTRALWRRLTFVYRDYLRDKDKVRKACKVALRLLPDDRQLRSCLAELDRETPDGFPQAVLGFRSLLKNDPRQAEPLHQLFALHREAGRTDAAFVAASAAVLRNVATKDEQSFYEWAHPETPPRRANRPLDASLIEGLRHPDDDSGLATLFRLLTPAIEERCPLSLGDFDVDESDLCAADALPALFAEHLAYASQQVGLADAPKVAIKAELEREVQAVAAVPSFLLVGAQALSLTDPVELSFRLVRAVCGLTPGRKLAAWRPRRTLKNYVLAGLTITFPKVVLPDPDGEVAEICSHLALAGDTQIAVKGAVTALQQRFRALNLSEWQRGVQRTADRIALLLCTDLIVAGRVLAALDAEAESDLVDFALSETYGELRASLGLAVAETKG